MITYNHEKYIHMAIKGVLMQKCNFDYELVIGEDYSTDKTRQICNEYAIKNSEIKLLPSENNLGMMVNFIRTLNACNGKYIALCEGDDYWTDPYKLQKQVDFLEANRDYGLIHTFFNAIDESGVYTGTYEIPLSNDPLFFQMQISPIVSTLTTVFRKEAISPLLERIKNENLWFIMDIWFWQQIVICWKVHYLPEVTAVYRNHPGGITKNKNALKLTGALITLDIYHTAFCQSNINIPSKFKYFISKQYFSSAISVFFNQKGKSYRSITFKLLLKHKWLIVGFFPACFQKIRNLSNRYF